MTPPIASEIVGDHDRHSVYVAAWREAERYKWIESEKAGFDLGENAIGEWARRHWRTFLRACWVDHLYGRVYWIELDRHDFGLLHKKFQASPLIPPIIALIQSGGENLNILLEARLEAWPMSDVISILEALDINSRRLEFGYAAKMAATVRVN